MTYCDHRGPRCEKCGFAGSASQLDVHHRDGDHSNDEPSNLATLCANCHRLEHGGAAMPDALYRALRAAGEAVTSTTADRDSLIREAHTQGCSLRHIANVVGLSHAGIAKIVKRLH